MAAADKQLFAPIPLRAMATDLSGLQMRVLACVASHDRMSLVTGKGQGCRASNDRMKEMIGCSYGKLCGSLSELVGAGLLQREKLGRHTVYRVIYTDDDRCLFGNTSRASTCDQTVQSDAATCDHDFSEARRNQPETASQYIPLNGGIHSVETGEDNSPEGARLASRDAANRKVLHRDGEPLHETLAKFERNWKADWTQYSGNIADWLTWLRDQSELALDNDDNTLGYRAQRLAETVELFAWEHGLIADDGWTSDDRRNGRPDPMGSAGGQGK